MPGLIPSIFLLAGMHALLGFLTWGFGGLIEQKAAEFAIAASGFLPNDLYNLFNAPFISDGINPGMITS